MIVNLGLRGRPPWLPTTEPKPADRPAPRKTDAPAPPSLYKPVLSQSLVGALGWWDLNHAPAPGRQGAGEAEK